MGEGVCVTKRKVSYHDFEYDVGLVYFLGFCPEASKLHVRNHNQGRLRPGLVLDNTMEQTRFGLALSTPRIPSPHCSDLGATMELVCGCP